MDSCSSHSYIFPLFLWGWGRGCIPRRQLASLLPCGSTHSTSTKCEIKTKHFIDTWISVDAMLGGGGVRQGSDCRAGKSGSTDCRNDTEIARYIKLDNGGSHFFFCSAARGLRRCTYLTLSYKRQFADANSTIKV